MKATKRSWLVFRALLELTRYETVLSFRGSGYILRQLSRQSVAMNFLSYESERDICDAVLLATCLYWKPVLCLQRSACTARLLKKYGINGRLVIGYRPSPFFSHAWVEVDGRIVNGSPAYQKRLRLLHVA